MTTKLSEIIDAATTPDAPLSDLLRRVLVVASRLDATELSDWVTFELNGYPDDAPLPPYRGPFQTEVQGDFYGPFGAHQNNPISRYALPEDLRHDWMFNVSYRQPISEIAEIAKSDRMILDRWPTDLIAIINGRIENGTMQRLVPMLGLVEAYKRIPPHNLAGVVDNVRTRVLGLALDLEKQFPQAGEPEAVPSNPETVRTVIHNHISGSGNNIAIASPGAVQTIVGKGDLAALLAAAREAGLSEPEVTELEQAVRDDEADADEPCDAPGTRVQALLGGLLLRGGAAMGTVVTGGAGGVVAELVNHYYGI